MSIRDYRRGFELEVGGVNRDRMLCMICPHLCSTHVNYARVFLHGWAYRSSSEFSNTAFNLLYYLCYLTLVWQEDDQTKLEWPSQSVAMGQCISKLGFSAESTPCWFYLPRTSPVDAILIKRRVSGFSPTAALPLPAPDLSTVKLQTVKLQRKRRRLGE